MISLCKIFVNNSRGKYSRGIFECNRKQKYIYILNYTYDIFPDNFFEIGSIVLM